MQREHRGSGSTVRREQGAAGPSGQNQILFPETVLNQMLKENRGKAGF